HAGLLGGPPRPVTPALLPGGHAVGDLGLREVSLRPPGATLEDLLHPLHIDDVDADPDDVHRPKLPTAPPAPEEHAGRECRPPGRSRRCQPPARMDPTAPAAPERPRRRLGWPTVAIAVSTLLLGGFIGYAAGRPNMSPPVHGGLSPGQVRVPDL